MSNDPSRNGSPGFWWRVTHLEPVAYRTLIVTTLALLSSFGIIASPGLSDNLIAWVVGLAGLIQILWVRPAVMPIDKVVSYLPEPVDNPSDIRAGHATTLASDIAVMEAATVRGA